MAKKNRAGKSTFTQKLGTFFLCTLLTLLFIWVLSFFIGDISDIKGPDTDAYFADLDQAPMELLKDLEDQKAEVARQVRRKQEAQKDYKASMENARQVLEEVADLQRLSIEKGHAPPESDVKALADARERFLAAQEQFETTNVEVTELNVRSFDLSDQIREQKEVVSEHRRPAFDRIYAANRAHRMEIAFYQLLIQLPLFLYAAWLVRSGKKSPYRPIYLSALVATFWAVAVIAWENFPMEYFKYVAIFTAILITLGFLRYILLNAVKPPRDLLLRRYRDSYEKCRCPICDFSVRRGSLRGAVWTKKGPMSTAGDVQSSAEEDPYICPSCGTNLFGKCDDCDKIRHSLLPNCEHCGVQYPVEETS
ncbi:MAG: hypothetical protein VX764_08880 [Planctomycetota bacterium]|nr:hypothetical protein [Planctomycetota bacterium]